MATVASKKAKKAEDFAISQSLLDIDEPDALRPGTCSSHVFTNPQSTTYFFHEIFLTVFFKRLQSVFSCKYLENKEGCN